MSTYRQTDTAYVKRHQPERAFVPLTEVQVRGLEPDVFTYNETISACENDSYLNVRLRCQALLGRGLEPNVITFSATISAYAKWPEPERALALWTAVQRRGSRPT